MARYLKNRSSKEIIAFLSSHGFYKTNISGDDAIFEKKNWFLVCKVTLNQKSTPIGTMQQIKRCSGYKSKEWIKWWKENKHGE
ncbi:MAG: hypothetical protein ABIG10_01530 [bacterium]